MWQRPVPEAHSAEYRCIGWLFITAILHQMTTQRIILEYESRQPASFTLINRHGMMLRQPSLPQYAIQIVSGLGDAL